MSNQIPVYRQAGKIKKSPLTPPKGGESLPPFREGWGGFFLNFDI